MNEEPKTTSSKTSSDREPSQVVLQATGVRKTYRLGRIPVRVLEDASIEVRRGEWVAILGASGSGKSTLLHLLGGLDRPDRGTTRDAIRHEGRDVSRFNNAELNHYRNRSVGFVFQFYHLLPELSVLENAMLPCLVPNRWIAATLPLLAAIVGGGIGAAIGFFAGQGVLPDADVATDSKMAVIAAVFARATLEDFGLGHRLRHKPSQLSGGERQRTAIARALASDPGILLADEPTGNLDAATGREILDLLKKRHDAGLTIVMVTHDPNVAEYADRVVRLEDGRAVETSP
ncbi:MAG: ABC transporter ATP-binding protein [Planctomycetota bacterium]|jgi:lipoprotein-releasing system ATP-binding protein